MTCHDTTSTPQLVGIRITEASALFPEQGILLASRLNEPRESIELDFKERLGRKGLRYNTKATLLALAAVTELLDSAEASTPEILDNCGLVAASAYGNYSSVCRVAEQLLESGVNGISPMDLPNASSNIIASQIAIRFGIQGVCITVDDGLNSGESVIRWASRLLKSKRCDRVIAVTAESPSEYEHLLRGRLPLVTGAVALLMELDQNGRSVINEMEPLPSWIEDFELASLRGMLSSVHTFAAASL